MKRMLLLVLALMLTLTGFAEETAMNQLPVENYQNPAPVTDIGDPSILYAEGAYWMYATSSNIGFMVWKSDDLVSWEKQELAYRRRPKTSWGDGSFWAPEVYAVDGKYYMFYSANWKDHGTLRIGVAMADHPAGPFTDLKQEPLFDLGYAAIDASLFIDDDGTRYLYFSRDCSENIVDGIHTSQSYVVELLPDFTGIVGEPQMVTTPDQEWEFASGTEYRWNEGPFVVKNDGKYWLFYSANYYESKEYAVGAAVADSPMGPFVKYENNPIMCYAEDESGKTIVSGTGHNFYFRVGDELFTSYHSHTYVDAPSGNRRLNIDRAGFHADGTPYINGPTLFPQLRPLADLGLTNAMANPHTVEAGAGAGDPVHLTDGDHCVAPASAAYTWTPADAESARLTYTWAEPQTVSTIQIHAINAPTGTVTITLNNSETHTLDFADLASEPGAYLTLTLNPTPVTTLSLQMTAPNTLGEVVVLG